MPRSFFLALAFCAASASGAQTPDTTTASRYFPLEVGNVWEYQHVFIEIAEPGHQRHTVVAKDGEWFVMERVDFDGDGAVVHEPLASRVRFDVGLGGLMTDGSAEALPEAVALGCGALAAPFGTGYTSEDLLRCALAPNESGESIVTTGGGYGQTVRVGAETRVTALKVVDTQGAEAITSYAAGIGYLGYFTRGVAAPRLSYARVGGVEIGTPLPVAAEPMGVESGPLAAYPNPAQSGFTVEVPLAMPSAVRMEVFDAIGRRVAVPFEGALGAGRHTLSVDARPLAPGVYVVQTTTQAGTSRVRVTVAR